MADVVSKQPAPIKWLRSVNTPDYPPTDWYINPDLNAVESWPLKYWIRAGTITLMNQAARDAVDAADDVATRQSDKDGAKDFDGTQIDRRLVGLMELMVDEINILRQAAGITPDRTLADYKSGTRTRIEGHD